MAFTLPIATQFAPPQDYSSTFEFDDEEESALDFTLLRNSLAEDDDDFATFVDFPLEHSKPISSSTSSTFFQNFSSSKNNNTHSSSWFSVFTNSHQTDSFALKSVTSPKQNNETAAEDEEVIENNSDRLSPPTLSQLLPSLLTLAIANLVLPVLIYYILVGLFHSDKILGLLLSAIPPTVEALYNVVSRKRLDAMATIVVTSIFLNISVLAITSNVTIGLLRESFITLLFGIVFLGSTIYPRPWTILYFWITRKTPSNSDTSNSSRTTKNLIYFLLRDLRATPQSISSSPLFSQSAYFEKMWTNSDRFRNSTRTLSQIWGYALIAEAFLRCILALLLQNYSVELFLVLSPMLFAVTVGGLVLVSAWQLKNALETFTPNDDSDAKIRVQERLRNLVNKNFTRVDGSVPNDNTYVPENEDEEHLIAQN
ncbi:hypothetical protein HK098_003787 [Nowakowskiella sp. JEL0407]|nr:hypothetical protein HK098_003787 [Nowakowskiella sp. JEL0407]